MLTALPACLQEIVGVGVAVVAGLKVVEATARNVRTKTSHFSGTLTLAPAREPDYTYAPRHMQKLSNDPAL